MSNLKELINLPHPITLKKWVDEEESYYIAEIPLLGGCSTHGYAIKEALKNIKEAKELWIEIQLGRGYSIPIPRNKTIIIEFWGIIQKMKNKNVMKQ